MINLLYIDDEILFIRTVKSIINHSEWKDQIDFTYAYSPYDAIVKVRDSTKDFNAVIVDYILEPDRTEEDAINGEMMVDLLKNEARCQKALFFLLSATNKIANPDFFIFGIEKGCDKLEESLNELLKKVNDYILFPLEIGNFFDKECYRFKGDSNEIRYVRYLLAQKLSAKCNNILIRGESKVGKSKLLNDIGKLLNYSIADTKYRIIKLSCRNYENTFKITFDMRVKNIVSEEILCFDDVDVLTISEQSYLSEWIEDNQNKYVCVFTCTDIDKVQIPYNTSITIPSLLGRESDIKDIIKYLRKDLSENDIKKIAECCCQMSKDSKSSDIIKCIINY